jgi:hypothetical protein
MIGILDWDIRIADTTLQVEAGSINIDEMNIPAITASVVVPYDAAVFDQIDPRQTEVPRAILTGRFTDWASNPLSAMTSYFADNGAVTLANVSTLWAGLQLRDVSAMFGSPLHAGAIDNETHTTMPLHLHVREIEEDERAKTMTVLLASDEALLTDWGPTDGLDMGKINDYAEGMNVQHARTYIDPLLQVVLGIRTDVNAYSTTALSTVYTDVIERSIDMSAWEMIRQPLDDANLKLRPNRDGVGFSLQHPVNEIPGKEWFSLITAAEVNNARQKCSRNDEWYDSVSLIAGDELATRVYKGGPTGVHSRTYRERFPESTPLTSSQVVNINTRNANRGQFIDITMPIRLGVFMMDEFTYEREDTTLQQWRVQAVTYDITSSTMNIRGVQRY